MNARKAFRFLVTSLISFAVLACVASPEQVETTCTDSALPAWSVTWEKDASESPGYRVAALWEGKASRDAADWILAHRPAQDSPSNYFEPDRVVRGNDIFGEDVPDRFVPRVTMSKWPPAVVEPTATLTAPNGVALFSPLWGCRVGYKGGKAGGKRLAVVGDSLVERALFCPRCRSCSADDSACQKACCHTHLDLDLRASGWHVFVQAASGQSLLEWLPVVREQALLHADVHIVALGTNDAMQQALAAPADVESRTRMTLFSVERALQAIRTANAKACTILVTVTPKVRTANPEPARYAAETDKVNSMLGAFAKDTPNVVLADWAGLVAEACGPTWVGDASVNCSLFDSDQLHLSVTGTDLRNRLLFESMNSCLALTRPSVSGEAAAR